MKQCKSVFLTLVVVIFAGTALTQAGGAGARLHHKAGVRHISAQSPSKSQNILVSAAGQRWRMGSATHWRSMLMQR